MARSGHNFRIYLRGRDLGSIIIVATDVSLVGQKLKLWPAAKHSVWAAMAASPAMVTETPLLPSPLDCPLDSLLPSPLFITFSTTNPGAGQPTALHPVSVFMLAKRRTRPGFLATVPATEKATVNARVAAEIHDWDQ
jgi:hypothetical protein